MKPQKLLALESLRGIAALSVAFYHFIIGSHFNNQFTYNSWIMVDFFFVLSGFVIALNYIDRITDLKDLVVFQKKRFLRLYPLHLLMLLVFVGIEFSKYIAEIKYNMVAYKPAFSGNNLSALLANLTLLQNWTFPNLTFNYPSWSISAEFYTYAIFGSIILFTKGKRMIMSIVLVICTIIFALLLDKYGMNSTNNTSGPLRCLYSFSIGAIIYFIYELFNKKSFISSSIPSIIMLLLSIVIIINFGAKDSEYLVFIPLLFGTTILVVVLTNLNQGVNRVLSNKALVYLGTISYGIYMIHAAVWWVFSQVLRFVFKFKSTSSGAAAGDIHVPNIFLADLISIFGLLIVLGLAHLSYKYIETRFNKLRAKI